MSRKTKTANKKSGANEKPPSVRKHSRMEEVLKVVEEYVAPLREFRKALRKKLFH